MKLGDFVLIKIVAISAVDLIIISRAHYLSHNNFVLPFACDNQIAVNCEKIFLSLYYIFS